MPSTVRELFAAAGVTLAGTAPWGTPIPEHGPGVYLVTSSADPDGRADGPADAPIDLARVQELLDVRPELRLDGMRPDAALLAGRLAAFWLPAETVLYAGLAGTSVGNRVGAYFRSPLGARRPHSGGWFVKTLRDLASFHVHYAPCEDPVVAEDAMLRAFSAAVDPAVAAALHDPQLPIPFGNLEWPQGRRKEHGIKGARGPLTPDATARDAAGPGDGGVPPARTQRVSPADLKSGRIRFPRAAKAHFPGERAYVDVTLRGRALQCLWDPRSGPPRERSGVLAVPAEVLDTLVSADEILAVDGAGPRVVLD